MRVLNTLSGNPLTESSTDGVIGEPGNLPEKVVKEHINYKFSKKSRLITGCSVYIYIYIYIYI